MDGNPKSMRCLSASHINPGRVQLECNSRCVKKPNYKNIILLIYSNDIKNKLMYNLCMSFIINRTTSSLRVIESPNPSSKEREETAILASCERVSIVFQHNIKFLQEELLKRYKVDNEGNLLFRETGESTKLTWSSLCAALQSNSEIYKKGTDNFVSKIVDGRRTTFYFNSESHLVGLGGSKIVYKALDVFGATYKAMKVAKRGFEQILREEVEFLAKIHANGHIQGVQRPPEAVFDLPSSKESHDFTAYITKLFPYDLITYLNAFPKMSTEERVKICGKVSLSFIKVVKSNHFHLDIKCENVLIDPRTGEVELIDISNTTCLTHTTGMTTLNFRGMTPQFVHEHDYRVCREPQLVANLCRNLMRLTMFSLSCVFFTVLTGRRPFSNSGLQYVDATHQLDDTVLKRCYPSSVSEYVLKALSHNLKERPGIVDLCRWVNSLNGQQARQTC